VNTRMRFGYPSAAARHQRSYLTKENQFVNQQEVAGDTRQGSRSAAGSDGADHRAEIQSMSERPHQLRLTTTGREIARLVRGGQGRVVSQEKGGLYFFT
jgi:hypothetical protein